DIGLRNAVFLGVEQRIMRPANDVCPLGVALTNGQAERLLGDDFRQDDVIVRIGKRQTNAIEAGLVGRIGVATTGIVSGIRLFDLLEDNRIIFHLIGAEIVGHVQLGRRTG